MTTAIEPGWSIQEADDGPGTLTIENSGQVLQWDGRRFVAVRLPEPSPRGGGLVIAQGGGVTDHAQLTNLDFASSGHTGFEAAGAAAAAVAIHAALTSTHGVTGYIVGTGGAQTLTDKTLTQPVINLPTISDWTNANHNHSSVATGGTISGGGGTPGGSDTQVQFNDGGAFGGDAGLVYNKTTDVLTLAGRLITPKWSPASDSTTALQVTRADGTTVVSRWNTTNGRFVTAPIQLIDTFLGSATGEFIWYDSSGGAGIRIQSTGDIYLRPYDGAAVFQFSSGELNINNPSGSAQVNVKATGGVDNYAAVRGHNANTASGYTQYCLYALVDPIGGASNIAGYFKAINSTANYAIYTDGGDCRLGASNSDKIGFHGATPVARQLLATGAGATVDDVITALQNLGLLRQS